MGPSTTKNKVFVVGLVGGIASGKSQVARMFQTLGGAVIDADRLGHSVLERPQVAAELSQLFGPTVLNADGSVHRGQLGKLVFGSDAQSAECLARLEQLVHPLIHTEAIKLLRQYQSSVDPPVAVVIDAPLLLEANWTPLCDLILFVDCPVDSRRTRARHRGWNADHFAARERAQLELEDKRRAATHFISGTMDEASLRRRVASLLQEMRKPPA